MSQQKAKVLAENRQARHLYFIEDTLEVGVVLAGWEVKAILAGHATFNAGAAFVRLSTTEALVDSLSITPLPYVQASHTLVKPDPLRARKLLLHKAELQRLVRKVAERGYTVVPLSLVYKKKVKLLIGLARGKKLVDKKDTIKRRDLDREQARDVANLSRSF